MSLNTKLNRDITILGTIYKLRLVTANNEKNYPLLEDANGYMDPTIKEIVVRIGFDEDDDIQNPDDLIRKNIRHEVIHAFLYESGLDCDSCRVNSWATSEEMVDYFAIQFPKIVKVLTELDAL